MMNADSGVVEKIFSDYNITFIPFIKFSGKSIFTIIIVFNYAVHIVLTDLLFLFKELTNLINFKSFSVYIKEIFKIAHSKDIRPIFRLMSFMKFS